MNKFFTIIAGLFLVQFSTFFAMLPGQRKDPHNTAVKASSVNPFNPYFMKDGSKNPNYKQNPTEKVLFNSYNYGRDLFIINGYGEKIDPTMAAKILAEKK